MIWIGLRKIKYFESEVRINPWLTVRDIKKKLRKIFTRVKLLNIKINYSLSSPWIRPDITLRTMVSLSIRTAFCITATTSSNSLLLLKIFFKSTFSAFILPPNAPTTTGTTYISKPGRCSLVSNASCLYFVNFSVLFDPMLFCCGHAMSQIQIFLSVFSSKIKSGLLAIVVFRRWNSKSHTSLALSFSSAVPLSHRCSYRWLLDPLIPPVLPRPLQESSVLGCAWLDIHFLLFWCIQLPGALPFQNVGCIFCNYHRLSPLLLLSIILSPPFAPTLS